MTVGVNPGAEFADHDAIRAMGLIREAYRAYEEVPALNRLRSESPVLVRGSGYMRSPVVLVGEAPGAEEEKRKAPFVGPSGLLLGQLLNDVGFHRSLCYVTNVVCYRPAGNRTPYPFEIAASRGRLLAEIEAVAPMLVITLGKTARRALRPDGDPVSFCHGKVEDSREIPSGLHGKGDPVFLEPGHDYKMLPTFHPAAALRDPAVLELLRADLEYLRQFAPARREPA
jgi:uracil-DNA glycosylase